MMETGLSLPVGVMRPRNVWGCEMDLVQMFSFAVGVAILVGVILLVRSGSIKERYSILWLLAAVVICVLSVFRGFLERLSLLVGIHYPPSLLFLVGVLFLLAINISFSVRISELSRRTNALAQELAILKSAGGSDRRRES